MFSMRSRRISAKLFVLPVLMIALFCGVAAFEVVQQHVRVQLLGTSFDVSDINQVLVQPTGSAATDGTGYYRLTSQDSITQLCRLLGTAKPYDGNEGDFATDIDSMLIESSNHVLSIPVARTSTNVILLFNNAHAYIAPQGFLTQLQQLAAKEQTPS
ncbi:hypothetical protein NZD89_21610 [Alicyclobacillus fastidiosus]|uniref:Uncharacterized protein n=1 Tax=Alicyclobacillus fastidiosus TaxID=392011 RepID=A0ABY6ZDF7_9BACL|nr:hypothetical protein [Alicyclobacillus fastidiosus]WAH40862.1 hypothetical protein NZD89_21610 [Alicyclobacillus fastidiosus]GMA62350.1 hypothetical protein GCM10025859_27900 [Alicyclobacillus fastidiosus]